MIKQFQQQLGVKLFFLLVVLIFLAIVPLTSVVFSAISYFGNYTTDINRTQIKEQAHTYLASIAREQAHKYDEVFSHVEVASSLVAAQAREVYDNIDYYAGFPGERIELTKKREDSVFHSLRRGGIVTAYWGGENINASTAAELQALSRLDPVFKGAKKEIPKSVATHMVTVTGIGRYLMDENLLSEGFENSLVAHRRASTELKAIREYTQQFGMPPGTLWSREYWGYKDPQVMITATSPVIDSRGNIRAVTGIDIPLLRIFDDMLNADHQIFSDVMKDTLFAFLLDSEGRIIAFPSQYLGLFGIDINTSNADSFELPDYHLSQSTVEVIPPLVPSLLGAVENVIEVKLSEEMYILNMHSLHKLNWHLVLVTKEKQLGSSIKHTEQALSGTIDLLIRKFAVNTVLMLIFVLFAVYKAVGYFVAPLRRLSEAALRVGDGDLKTRCHLNRKDELGTLADSFNDMVRQLESAADIKKDQARELEQTVAERTKDLQNKNFLLRNVICELNLESDRRKRAVQALRKSEEQVRVAMDASLAGHVIIQDMAVRYANPTVLEIFGYSLDELINGNISVNDLVAPEYREDVLHGLDEKFSGKIKKPFVIGCNRKDGAGFDALVGGAQTVWKGNPAVVATVMDISEQKQTQAQLEVSKKQLQESLAEKEVLLREIYHRTKNNMLVIISMLNLQAMDIDDERVKTLFKETENRIRAMSLVHEKLYQSQNLVEIDLGQYLEEMVTALVRSMVIGDRIRVQIDCAKVAVSIDNIVPLGLAVNEIITNSLKHGFPGDGKGTIFVTLSVDSTGVVELVAGDNGIGLPEGIDIGSVRSFGMQITVNLIEKQLRGSLEIDRSNGTRYRIRFKECMRQKRI